PGYSALRQETRKVQLIILAADLPRATRRSKGIIVIEDAKICTGFRPDVVGLRRVNVGVVPARCCQNIAVVRGIGRLLTDVDLAAINDSSRGSVHQAVDERCSRILKDLLD